MKIEHPEISVLLVVKNGEPYIREAVDSVLAQSFENFELVVIDSGSDDRTVEIVRKYTDPRIKVVRTEDNYVQSLNAGLDLARGAYIAHMDADDVMHSEKLRIQIKRMKQDPRIDVCTTWFLRFSDGKLLATVHQGEGLVQDPASVLLKENLFCHPTALIKKDFLLRNRITYSFGYLWTEDYKLWFDIARQNGVFYIEPQELLFYRMSDEQVTKKKAPEMKESSLRLRTEILFFLLDRYDRESLRRVYTDLHAVEKEGLIATEDIIQIFIRLFQNCEKLKNEKPAGPVAGLPSVT